MEQPCLFCIKNMKPHRHFLFFLHLVGFCTTVQAQYPIGDNWYQNPLGFEPVKLHTSMGFILPAAAVGTCLILTAKDSTLVKKLTIYNESGFSWGYKYPYTFVAQNSTGINFMLRKWMSAGVEFIAFLPKDKYNSTAGVAIRPFARFYPVNKENYRIYFESGGGFIYFFDEFPQPTYQDDRLGTYFNGITKYGIGAEIKFTQSSYILFGIRHLHVSNGNSKGVERNPSHDSNGFFIGFSYTP
ncbi:MAG: hypothetical protein CMP77_07560 [Flavobacterium sp.]|nr:hypothetical protein [Flavobacterium sp.]